VVSGVNLPIGLGKSLFEGLFIHLNKRNTTIVFLTLFPLLFYSLLIYCSTVWLMSGRASGQAKKNQTPPLKIPGYTTDKRCFKESRPIRVHVAIETILIRLPITVQLWVPASN
jgi:hypothetical protein